MMDVWGFILTGVSGGAIGVLARELVTAYLRLMKGRHDISALEVKQEIEEQQRHEARTEAYISQLRADYEKLKSEFEAFKLEVRDRETKWSEELQNLQRQKQATEIELTRAIAKIEQYEEKLVGLNVKFKPWKFDSGTYPALPIEDQSNDSVDDPG